MRHGRVPFILGFLVAPVTLYSYFVLWPYVQTINLSFYQWRGFTKKRWVGLENYDRMLHADRFYQALEHHAVILVLLPLATIAFALFFAFLLNVGGKARVARRRGSGVRVSTGSCSSFPRSSPCRSSACSSRRCTGPTSPA